MKLNRTASIIIIILINIIIDQASKFIVRAEIAYQRVIEVIGDTFILTNVENEGAFLGMGSDMNPTVKLLFLMVLPVLVLGYVIYYIITNRNLDRTSLIAFCCIVGGGIANVADRIFRGSVTDFLHLDFGGMFRTGIFNVADMSVTFGMIVLLYAGFRNRRIEKAREEEMSVEENTTI